MDECVILCFRSILFQLWWYEMGVRASFFPEDSIQSRANIYMRSYNVVTTSSWRRIDDDARMLQRAVMSRSFMQATRKYTYTTRDACSLQRSDGVNFLLFLALWHASRITTRKREVAKLLGIPTDGRESAAFLKRILWQYVFNRSKPITLLFRREVEDTFTLINVT